MFKILITLFYLPGNLAAAHLIFRCLNDVRANIASQSTSADGSEQTITIKIPTECNEVDDGCIRVSCIKFLSVTVLLLYVSHL